jgi:hypothetical protein
VLWVITKEESEQKGKEKQNIGRKIKVQTLERRMKCKKEIETLQV